MKIIDKVVKDEGFPEEEKNLIIIHNCPSDYGYANYEVDGRLCLSNRHCERCWNRDIEENDNGIFNRN